MTPTQKDGGELGFGATILPVRCTRPSQLASVCTSDTSHRPLRVGQSVNGLPDSEEIHSIGASPQMRAEIRAMTVAERSGLQTVGRERL